MQLPWLLGHTFAFCIYMHMYILYRVFTEFSARLLSTSDEDALVLVHVYNVGATRFTSWPE